MLMFSNTVNHYCTTTALRDIFEEARRSSKKLVEEARLPFKF
jgi:hypothetical protein